MPNYPRIWDLSGERTIVGETKVSWLVEREDWLEPLKVNKKNPNKPYDSMHPKWFFSEEEINNEIWANKNFHAIKNSLGGYVRYISAATLRRVAEVIGYKEPQP